MHWGFLLLHLLLCVVGHARQVLLVHTEKPFIAISQDKDPLAVLDRVCVVRDKVDIACGYITITDPKYAIVKLDYNREEIKKFSEQTKTERWVELDIRRPTPVKGDKVRLEMKDPKKQIRELTSDLVASNTFAGEVISEERQLELDLALKKIEASRPFKPVSVLAVGMNYVFPLLTYQQAMTPNWGLGMTAMYMDLSVSEGTGALKGPGFFFTYNRYYSGPLKGLWWQLSPGAFRLNVKGTETVDGIYQPVVLATVGWRASWKEKMNFGIALGTLYFPFGRNAGNTGIDFNGIVPSIVFDAGIIF